MRTVSVNVVNLMSIWDMLGMILHVLIILFPKVFFITQRYDLAPR